MLSLRKRARKLDEEAASALEEPGGIALVRREERPMFSR
jgi:hypothetical protein